MGATILAHLESDPAREVAIKIEHVQTPQKGFLEQEIDILRALDHPNIIKTYPIPGDEDNWVGLTESRGERFMYALLEYVPGGSLDDKLRQSLSFTEIERVLNQICDAVDYSHANGILHLDLKPANILFSRSGRRAVICDFGIAETIEPAPGIPRTSPLGTPGYAAPERIDRLPGNGKADIYSLGVILAEMAVGGLLPYSSRNSMQKDMANIQQLPRRIREVILTAINEDPEQRFPNALSLAKAFHDARINLERRQKLSRIIDRMAKPLMWLMAGFLLMANVGLIIWLVSLLLAPWIVNTIQPLFAWVSISPLLVVPMFIAVDLIAYLVFRKLDMPSMMSIDTSRPWARPTYQGAYNELPPMPVPPYYPSYPSTGMVPRPPATPVPVFPLPYPHPAMAPAQPPSGSYEEVQVSVTRDRPPLVRPGTEMLSLSETSLLDSVSTNATDVFRSKPDYSPLASIKIVKGQKDGGIFGLSRTRTLIGRAAENEVVLPDSTASFRHAEIQRIDGEFQIIDLGSSNGTFVNSERIVQRFLQDGDQIVIGGAILAFRLSQAHTLLQRLKSNWTDFSASSVTEDFAFAQQATRSLATLIASIINAPEPPIVSQLRWYYVYNLSTEITFADTLLPTHLPLIFSIQTIPSLDDIEQIRLSYAEKTNERPSVLVVILPSQRVQEADSAQLLAHAQSRSLDLVVIGFQDLQDLVLAQDAHRALRHLVLSRVRLRSGLSPFKPAGPTPTNMFFGRSNELRDIAEGVHQSSFAVVGGRRIGKTSLLLRLHGHTLPAAGYISLYYYCSTTTSLEGFLDTTIRSSDWQPSPPIHTIRSFRELFAAESLDKPLVLLFDEADKLVIQGNRGQWELFDFLRSVTTTSRAQMVVCGERTLRNALRDSGSPVFNFGREILLGPLDFNAVRELVIRPMNQLEIALGDDPQAIARRIFDFTSGHPSIVQRLCCRLIDRVGTVGGRRITLSDIESVIDDQEFLRDDFLDTFWDQASTLEKIITLVMVDDPSLQSLNGIRQVLRNRFGMEVKARDADEALQQLVDMRSMLRRLTPSGYEFAIQSFPMVLSRTTTSHDLLDILVEEFKEAAL